MMERQSLIFEERKAIDIYLKEMAQLNATLGKDSIEFEIYDVKQKIRVLEEKINKINPEFLIK